MDGALECDDKKVELSAKLVEYLDATDRCLALRASLQQNMSELSNIVNRNTLSAISKTRGKPRWSSRLSTSSDWVGPVMGGGILIAASSSGQMAFVSPQDGKVLRKIDLGEPVYISPIISSGTMYVLTDEATLMAFR